VSSTGKVLDVTERAPAEGGDADPDAEWEPDLALAFRLADEADAITTTRFLAGDLLVEAKPDLTPVTDADRAVEQAIRTVIAEQRPADAFLGEEYGVTGNGPRRWVVDPIDGTKNFVRGVPVWATLIALQHDGRSVVGVVSAPALGRRWWASAGAGAWAGGALQQRRRCEVSRVAALSDASLSYSSHAGWQKQNRLAGFTRLLDAAWRTRAYGDFWSHILVAEGAIDAAFEPEVSLWDLAALAVIVTEAGGRFTDLSGVQRADGGSAVSSNGLLHDAVLQALAPASARP
jgi:histidinol-phosphatase